MPTHSRRVHNVFICTLISIIGIFYLLTIRDGHNWGGDFSMYIQHAKNISEGKTYGETGYIYNPFEPSLGPKTYPPIFPIILAAVYSVSGLDFNAMKVISVFALLISLYFIFLNFKDKLTLFSNMSIVGLIGFNYYFWSFKDNILSDLPFLLFIYIFFYVTEKAFSADIHTKKSVVFCILSGIFLYFSYGTRSIGIVLLPSILLYDIIKNKKLSLITILISIVFMMLFLFQSSLLQTDRSYYDQINIDYNIIIQNIQIYLNEIKQFFDNGYSPGLNKLLFIIISFISLLGFIIRIKKFEIYEVFLFLYLTVIVIWPANERTRFLIPIIPLYLYYFFYFCEKIDRIYFNGKSIKYAIPIFMILTVTGAGLSYFMLYHKRGLTPIYHGVHREESLKVFNAIKRKTDEKDIVIFKKPRVLSLLASRRSSTYHKPGNDEELLNYLRNIEASYILVEAKKDVYLSSFIDRNTSLFRLIYLNDNFRLYKITK
jgi:hypothetical protein